MKRAWIIPVLALAASSVLGAVPKMESTSFVITSSEFSAMGKYKTSASFDTWDTLGQPSPIGPWPGASANSGAGWIYTISKPIFYDKDHDHDGMPTAFENQYPSFLSDNNPADAALDEDGDGLYNIQEFLARTDPSDSSAFFQFTDIRIVSEDGLPTLTWQNPTVEITGFEAEYPNYPRSLGFDVLYADWSRSSQFTGEFPSANWFNLTGTWKLHPSGVNLPRNPDNDDNIKFKDTTASGLADKAIRFYRLAIAGTWLEGEPIIADSEATWRYYTEMGEYRLASTLAKEVMMIQKHNIPGGETQVTLGVPGDPAGEEGTLDLFLGTDFFPRGSSMAEATIFRQWVTGLDDPGSNLNHWLSYSSGWREESGSPATGKVPGEDGFFLTATVDWIGYSECFPALSFYAGASLKTDGYYHDIYRRNDGPPYETYWAIDSRVQEVWKPTLLNYNYPVSISFKDTNFPALAGTDSPPIPGWQGFMSDWVVFYNQDLSAIGGNSNEPVVIVYYDHVTNHDWTYHSPFFGQAVGPELKFNPGSPFAVIQYWDPDEPVAWSAFTFGFDLPYQEEAAVIKSYLQWVDD